MSRLRSSSSQKTRRRVLHWHRKRTGRQTVYLLDTHTCDLKRKGR